MLFWPGLFDAQEMVAAFGTDSLPAPDGLAERDGGTESEDRSTVAVRIPYNLPLQSYGQHEEPWVATQTYTEPDCFGRAWEKW